MGAKIEKSSAVQVYQYLDFRKYLKEAFAFYKQNQKLTLRSFADRAGFASHAFLKRVIDGERSLSLASVRKIARGFRLDEEEARYLADLVSFNQAETIEEKNELFELLLRRMPQNERKRIHRDQFEVFRSWYIMAIRELVSHPEFKEDPAWIAKTLYPSISKKEAADAIEVLVKNEFLIRDEQGRLQQAVPSLTTGDETRSLALKNYHRSIMDIAARNMMTTHEKWRDVSSLSFLLEEEQFKHIKARMQEFRKEILQYVENTSDLSPDQDARRRYNLYNLNMQLFHVTKNQWNGESKDD